MESGRSQGYFREPFLPTRLIDVHAWPPRLVLSQDLRKALDPEHIPKYAALSYCWGDESDAKLQSQSLSANRYDLTDRIPVESLSRAQRDAIEVTQEMGLHYLWNDAFCIKQDDRDDWEAEASCMAQVYQHAAFTFVSTQGTAEPRSGPQIHLIP